MGRVLALRRDVTLADARALADPLVGGFDLAGQILVTDDLFGKIGSTSKNDKGENVVYLYVFDRQ